MAAHSSRIASIDILRGIVIVLMALDHVREFFAVMPYDPDDLAMTTPAWFLTRWITHFCAPVFVCLAGTSAWLYGQKVGPVALSKFLWSRGLWLIFIELTFVNLFFKFQYFFDFFFVQVIWVIGWSMIILGFLIHLPRWFQVAFTAVLILGHNLLDGISIDAYWWQLLHQARWETPVYVVYPLIPWPAVMVFGYLTGRLFTLDATVRKKLLLRWGVLMTLAFVVLRLVNGYGDPQAWTSQTRGALYTVLDFFNTTKYPPSLQYLCMTLGPALIFLSMIESWRGKVADFFLVFGKEPFFAYLMHLLMGHLMAVIYHGLRYGEWRMWRFDSPQNWPVEYVPSLVPAYVAWALLILVLYVLCRKYSDIKRTHSAWWFRYI